MCRCRPGSPVCAERSHVVLVGGAVASQALILLLRDASSLIGMEGTVELNRADIDQDRVVEATLAVRALRVAYTVFHLSGMPRVCHRVRRVHDDGGLLQQAA